MMDPKPLMEAIERLKVAADARDFEDEERQVREAFILRLMAMMDWKRKKATAWMKCENPNFGMISPDCMIKMCRAHKIKAFIDAMEEENGLQKRTTP